jgi:putative restriction endonuclease
MKQGQTLWTRDELILAINLYCKLPFGRLHKSNPDVINLANLIGRTPSAMALKLVNFASLDPSLKARGIKGAGNSSKLDELVWDYYFENWDALPYESEALLAQFKKIKIEELYQLPQIKIVKTGETRDQIIRARVNQSFFRSAILAAYNSTCCITGIQEPTFLIAGHIKPWSIDAKNRLNPQNGIAINALHDKAFESGMLTITPEYKIHISSILLKQQKARPIVDYFTKYHLQDMILPSRFLPDVDFLKYHNQERFVV